MPASRPARQGIAHDLLGLADDGLEVLLVPEALCVDLVDVLRPGRPCRKPAAPGHDLEAPDGGIVARRLGQLGDDGLAGQVRLVDGGRREFLQPGLLCRRGRRIDARVAGRAELHCQLPVVLAGILACARRNLRRQQVHDRTVLVRRPDSAVVTQEARPGAFLASEA
jgi:hypothetical protein